MPAEQTTLKEGQVWQEVDPRDPRYVRVTRIDGRSARIQTVVLVGDGSAGCPHEWRPIRTSTTRAALARFNGKRSGYALYEDVP